MVSETLKRLSRERIKSPNLILEIEGFSVFFSTLPVETLWRLDDGYFFDTTNLRWDSPFPNPKYLSVIDDKGSSKTLAQQILPDKEGTSSVPTINITLVDLDKIITNNFKFTNQLPDILGRKANVYFTYKGASHPEDSLPILNGYIDDYTIEHGQLILSISHPENLKRKEIFDQYLDKITSEITAVQTSIPVINTSNLFLSQDCMTSYIRINDEVMKVTNKTQTSLTVQRGQFGSIPDIHEIDSEVTSIYELVEDPIELALKLYMSSTVDSHYGSIGATSYRFINNDLIISNAIFFENINIQTTFGLVEGDTVRITGSTNNDGSRIITGFGVNDFGTWILTNNNLNQQNVATGLIDFKSKYSVLPFGLRLTGREVDVEGHEDIVRLNPNNFPAYTFYLKEQVNGKEFIDREVYFPVSLFSIPRNAKISLKLVQPPLANNQIVTIDETNIENIQGIKIKRSSHKYLYNTIFYRFNEDPIDEDFTSGAIFRNENSIARIPIGTKQMTVNSRGLRESESTRNLLFRQQQRLLDRYKFAAQEITNVSVFNEVGFSIEVGDIIVFGSDNLQMTDLSTGERIFKARLVEVINKEFDLFTGRVNLTLLESAFDLEARYGIISPSSIIATGSTLTQITLSLSFSIGEFERETDKWSPFIGRLIRVRSKDYTVDFTTTIKAINQANLNNLIVEQMPQIPQSGWIVEIPLYEEADSLYKDIFVYFNPSATITSVVSAQVFSVTNISRFFVGSQIYVVSNNFSYDSFELEDVKVDSISGNQITLNKPLPSIPPISARVELIGFVSDEGYPWRII